MGNRPRSMGAWGAALVGALGGGMGAQACGEPDRPDMVPFCEDETCEVSSGPLPTGQTSPPVDAGAPIDGAGGLPELAPPAGAPADGLGVDGILTPPGTIGVGGTIGVDGVQRVPPGVVLPGGAPRLPGPDDRLSPAPGTAVDPVTGLVPPRDGTGVLTPGPVGPAIPVQPGQTVEPGQPVQPGQPVRPGQTPLPPLREPTEDRFSF